MSNTFIGHGTRYQCTCGYTDTKDAFKEGICPYCEQKTEVKKVLELHEDKVNNIPNISRLEVIEDGHRKYVNWKVTDVKISIQDQGRTLKIFTKEKGKKEK